MLRFAWLSALFLLLPTASFSWSQLSSGPHIADVNILLPPKITHPVEYRLQGSDGCFKWSWDHHDVLSVIPEYNATNHCSTSARVRSIAPFSGRKETAVYAADVYTGTVIRCKVFIDNVSRIQIFHNSVKLDLDGLATLRARAFDSEDNVFSSLVGLQFMWELKPEIDALPHHLVHVPLKDSPLSDCSGLCGDLNIQIKLEDNGVFSDLFVVKGVGIGHESVSVHLLEPQFNHLADKIALTVAEAMSLEPPSPVFVLVGASFQFTLKVIRANALQVVTLPSPHHKWSILNSSVAEVDPIMAFIHALNLGLTTVIVEDTRVAGHTHLSSLNVVLPHNLYLYKIPLSSSGEPIDGIEASSSMSRWYIICGRQYRIQMKVFSPEPDAREVYITESDDLKLHDEQSEYWTTFLTSEDTAFKHDWHNSRVLKATSLGTGKLAASLRYVGGHHEMHVLKVAQEVHVCGQVKFNLERVNGTILLPWAPNIHQELELKATGGCAKAFNDYKWFSSDISTLSVSTSGVVQAKKPGKATVKVVSIFDSLNYDEVVIEVSIPSYMVMLQNLPVETVVGSLLHAAVTLKTSSGASFYRCDAFHPFVKWKAASSSFVVLNETEESLVSEQLHNSVYVPPCAWAHVYASAPGQTMLHATFSKDYHDYDKPFQGPVVLKSSSRIAAYPPLTLHQIGDGNQFGGYWFDTGRANASNHAETLERLYLVPGTSLDVLLLGGPEPWEKGVDFMETVEILGDESGHIKDKVHVQQVSWGYQSVYRVSCGSLGSFELVFKRGNLVGDDLPLPAVADVTLSLSCSFPSSVVLIVDEPVNKHDTIRSATLADRSTGRILATPVTVANGQTIRLAAVGISSSGEAFANSSSISLKWELSSCERLASWDDAHESERSKSSWERFLALKNDSGQCVVRATADSHYSAKLQSSKEVLTDAIRLELVSTLGVNPEFNLLYFNPNSKVNLSITGGSCWWEAVVNDSQVVEIIQPRPGLQCLQLTVSPRGFGTAHLTVSDVGLTPPMAASAVVQVADIDWIKIVSGDELSLMEGQSQFIDLTAGINDGSTFNSDQFAFMDIHVFTEDDVVELVGNDGIVCPGSGCVNGPSFKIRAKHLGMTTLFASVRQHSGREVLSQPIKIEVFEPLRIHPQVIFLVPGASYQLTVKGGPTIGAHVEYVSMDDGVATVDKSSGHLFGISPGNTTILSRVHGSRDVIICHAYTSVKVGVPSSAILNAQSDQLDVGRDIPVFPSFLEGDLFSFFGLCTDFKWSVDDEKVLGFKMEETLHGQKHWSSLDDEKEHAFLKVLYGRFAGRTNVAVSFSCDFVSTSYSKSRIYNASLSLLVVPDLPLALGIPITWVLPPHYVTSSLLPSSSNSYGQLDGQTHKGTIIYSLLRSYEKHEDWQKDAITIDGERIRTTESRSTACIQAKDRTTGRIEIASCVKVAEVAQIRILSNKVPRRIIYLAVGAELHLPITYFDTFGNPFYEALNAVIYHVDTNYHDIISIGDARNGSGSVYLKAMQHGKALLRVSLDSNPQKSDYVLISVGAHVYPQSPVLLQGSSLDFNIEGIYIQFSGRWHSANESVVSIDMQSGKAKAVGIGSTLVFFDCPTTKLQTVVTVLPGSALSVDPPKEILTNVPYPTKGYRFAVRFSDTDNQLDPKGDRKGVLHDCKVDPSFVGYAKPWIDLHTGHSYCLFFPHSPEHLGLSAPRFLDTRPYVSVSVNASLKEASHVSGSVSAIFVGGFSIMEMDKGLMQLKLTPDSKKTVITILGNTDVEIHWLERDSIKISLIQEEEFGIGGRAQYEVKALGERRVKDKLIVTLPASGQREEIDISYDPGNKESHNHAFKIILAVILGLPVLILATGTCMYYTTNRTQPYVAPPSAGFAEPQTPGSGSTVFSEQSPRTPQPFVDYVRRTIDETPNYRREARRRFNPQNTY